MHQLSVSDVWQGWVRFSLHIGLRWLVDSLWILLSLTFLDLRSPRPLGDLAISGLGWVQLTVDSSPEEGGSPSVGGTSSSASLEEAHG